MLFRSDWAKAKADGVEGAIIRLGYGEGNNADKKAQRNISECMKELLKEQLNVSPGRKLMELYNQLLIMTHSARSDIRTEAPSYGQPITLYDPRSTGAEAYRLLAEEVINREVE